MKKDDNAKLWHDNRNERAEQPVGCENSVVILLGIAIGLRVFNFYGFIGSDDSNYLRLARDPWRKGVIFDAHDKGCEGVWVPCGCLCARCRVSAMRSSCRSGQWQLSVCNVHHRSPGGLVGRPNLVGRTGARRRTLDGRSAHRNDQHSQLLPDLPGSVWAFLGIVLIEWARRSDRAWHPIAGSMLGGAFLGFGWLCKETIVYIVFVVFLYWIGSAIRNPKRWRTLIGAGAGFGLILLVEMVVYWQISGDALFRFHVTEANFTLSHKEFSLGVGGTYFLSGQWTDLLDRLFVQERKLFFLCPYYGGIILIGSLAAVCVIVKRWKPV